MLSFTQVIGSTLDVAGVGLNRTGTKNCSLLVFFWSGHGDYKEKNNPGKKAYLSLKGGGRVYTRDLGDWLKNFQDNHLVKHALGGAQFRKDPAPVLMILQACHAGGFMTDDLLGHIVNPNGGEVLMSSKEGECSYGPLGATPENSYFVKHVLEGMAASGAISGYSIFEAADKPTTKDANDLQHPIEQSDPLNTTIFLHQ